MINVASGTCFSVPKSVLLIAEAYVVDTLCGPLGRAVKAWERFVEEMDKRLCCERGFPSVWLALAWG